MKAEKKDREKGKAIWYLPQILYAFAGTFLCVLAGLLLEMDASELLQTGCFSFLGLAMLGLAVRLRFPYDAKLRKASRRRLSRFWIAAWIALALALISAFLPNMTWPFLPIFVVLGLYGTPFLGLLGGAVLLTVPVLLSGGGAGVFFLYFISGAFGLVIFLPLKKEAKILLPMILSLVCLFVCEIGGIILTLNAELSFMQFLLPAANVILSAVLLLAGVQQYAVKELYPYRDLYLYLNDTEHPKLAALRSSDRKAYMQSIHTAYFCERIGSVLGLDTDVLKCVGYYHRLTPLRDPEREAFFDEMNFTVPVRDTLIEFSEYALSKSRQPIRSKMTAILLCSQTMITTVLNLYEKGETQVDAALLVQRIFQRFEEHQVFASSDLTIHEYDEMKKVFEREKLYYDFLH